MFTGIVETTGIITKSQAGRLGVRVPWEAQDLCLGQSIAVDGCCLSIVKVQGHEIEFDLTPETLERTVFNLRKPKDSVNLERSLKLGESLDGHLVTGHVDVTGTIRSVKLMEDSVSKEVWIDVPYAFHIWLVEKGSVAVDGVSLTVNEIDKNGFSMAWIPHTLEITSLGIKQPGDQVNVEFDLIAKYVSRMLQITDKTHVKGAVA